VVTKAIVAFLWVVLLPPLGLLLYHEEITSWPTKVDALKGLSTWSPDWVLVGPYK